MEKTIDQNNHADDNTLVVVHNLSKSFLHGVWSIKKVNFKVNRGEAIALVGNNGAGKTVLGKLIGNVIQQTSGIIDYFFKEPNIFKAIGYQSREQSWPIGFKVKDVIDLYKAIYDVQDKAWIAKLIDTFGFEQIMDKKLSKLNILSLQMFALFLAFLYKPELIVIDEFSSSVDFEHKMKILNLLKEYKNQGGTIIIIQPEDFILNALCNRIITLNKGEMQDDSSLRGIVKEHGSTFEYIRKLAEEAKENKRRVATNRSFQILLKKFRTAFKELEAVYKNNFPDHEGDKINIQIKNTFYQLQLTEEQLAKTFSEILIQKNINQAIKELKQALKELTQTIYTVKKHIKNNPKEKKYKNIVLELEKMATFIEKKVLLIFENDELFSIEETEEEVSSLEKKQLRILKKKYIKEEIKIIKLERKLIKKNKIVGQRLETLNHVEHKDVLSALQQSVDEETIILNNDEEIKILKNPTAEDLQSTVTLNTIKTKPLPKDDDEGDD
ncbi:ATP-binding cassette domain-containing protein [Williamsoniiplasma lucivorax]|uniref:ABC transporter ATP-binding protein n=1 Tax=Williamsoniiplasma lucivorax TaxID=209274 RepID=A0A2S5RE98_9MOLU|nr:ATP-binding cassette domain-containing protein [Williamsoniiplasma lucivorax]PPE05455.1 ABC transporter ATP-binding protein [Williamsoniiplasma lucivorax]